LFACEIQRAAIDALQAVDDHDVRARSYTFDSTQVAIKTDIGQHIIVETVTPISPSITIPPLQNLTMPAKLTPLKDLRVLRHQIPAHGLTPNTSIQNKPLLIYRSAFTSTVTAGEIETHLSSVGVVSPQWRYSMYTTSHFHVSQSVTSLVPARLTSTLIDNIT
jgi:hypothetical protein